MNLSESIGDPSSEIKSPWNFSQNQPVFKQPMTNPPPIQRVISSPVEGIATGERVAEPEFRVPANPPCKAVVVPTEQVTIPVACKPTVSPEPNSDIKENCDKVDLEPVNIPEEKQSVVEESSSQEIVATTEADTASKASSPPDVDCEKEESVEFRPEVSFTVGDDEKSTDTKEASIESDERKEQNVEPDIE